MVPLYFGYRYGSIWLVSNGGEPPRLNKAPLQPFVSRVHRLGNGPGCRSSVLLQFHSVLHSLHTGTPKESQVFSQCAIKSQWHEKWKPRGQAADQILSKKLLMVQTARKSHWNEGCFWCHHMLPKAWSQTDSNFSVLNLFSIESNLHLRILLPNRTWPKHLPVNIGKAMLW